MLQTKQVSYDYWVLRELSVIFLGEEHTREIRLMTLLLLPVVMLSLDFKCNLLFENIYVYCAISYELLKRKRGLEKSAFLM